MTAQRTPVLVLALAALLLAAPGQAGEEAAPAGPAQLAQADNGFDKVVFLLDFADYREGSVEAWLKAKGFVFERDADNRRRIDLDVAEASLIIEARTSAHGLLIDESVDVAEYSRIRIEWGVNLYPEGASYEKDARSEAIMVMVFFGYDKISSGSMLIPNSPYFLGLFLCEGDRVGHPYVGRYFQKGGRYICLETPGVPQTQLFIPGFEPSVELGMQDRLPFLAPRA